MTEATNEKVRFGQGEDDHESPDEPSIMLIVPERKHSLHIREESKLIDDTNDFPTPKHDRTKMHAISVEKRPVVKR